MRASSEIRPKTDRLLGTVRQKPQNDKRAMRCYRCDPLGHVPEHAHGVKHLAGYLPINRILVGYEDRSVFLYKAVNEPFQGVRSEIAD